MRTSTPLSLSCKIVYDGSESVWLVQQIVALLWLLAEFFFFCWNPLVSVSNQPCISMNTFASKERDRENEEICDFSLGKSTLHITSLVIIITQFSLTEIQKENGFLSWFSLFPSIFLCKHHHSLSSTLSFHLSFKIPKRVIVAG